MIFFSLGLPGRFTEWCDAVIARLAAQLDGGVTAIAFPSTAEMLQHRAATTTLDEVGLTFLRNEAAHLVVGTRQPDMRLRSVLEEGNIPFVLALDDPRLAVRDIVAQLGAPVNVVTRAIANSCPFLMTFTLMSGALTLHADRVAADPHEAVRSIASHFGIPVSESEIAELVGDEVPFGRTTPDPAADVIPETEQKMVDGALGGYAQWFACGTMGSIVWTRELFLLVEDTNRQPTRALDVSGKARNLIFGPYIHLPPAAWVARTVLGFSKGAAGGLYTVDVYNGVQLGVTHIRPASAGIVDASVPFRIDAPTPHGIEIRVSVSEDMARGEITFGHVVLTPQWIQSSKGVSSAENDFLTVLDL